MRQPHISAGTLICMTPDASNQHEWLVHELTSSQTRLYGFVLTLLPDRDAARDVLQETNLVIWRKADEFESGTDFWAWATQIARYQVLSHFRDSGRDRLVFDEAVVEKLATAAEKNSADVERVRALVGCIQKLPATQAEVVTLRYRSNSSIDEIARERGQTVAAVKMLLLRARRALAKCVELALKGDGQP